MAADRPDLAPAARQVRAVAERVEDAQLTRPTPCGRYGVGDLLDHLMGLALAFTRAAEKTTGEPADGGASAPPPEPSAQRLDPDWRRELPRRLDTLAAAWREPAAWSGETEAGGVTLPAQVMGLVAMNELVIHGWDLARATGQPFACDPATTDAVFGYLTLSAEETGGQGAEGLFGPVVEVPQGAPLLDRAVALSGRDPAWTP